MAGTAPTLSWWRWRTPERFFSPQNLPRGGNELKIQRYMIMNNAYDLEFAFLAPTGIYNE